MTSEARSTTRGRRFRRVRAVVAIVVTGFALGSCARSGHDDAKPTAAVAPQSRAWGDTRVPYRAGGGAFCDVAAEETSIRPDVVNRLEFLEADDASGLVTELRAGDRELVTTAPIELQSDVRAIAQAATRLYDGLEANGFNLQGMADDTLGSLSAADLRPSFERAGAYLWTQCGIDVQAILSTV